MGIRIIHCVFGEERRIKKFWCVFWVFICVFCVWERGKTCRKTRQRAKLSKKWFSSVWKVRVAFYSPNSNFEAVALEGPPPLKGLQLVWSWHVWKCLEFLFLNRYGSWKSNGRIKSYGSQKFVVHWSLRYLGFCDISAVLTPILIHEQYLEWEFDNLHNGVSFNPFWQSDQN